MEGLQVEDVMIRGWIGIAPDASIREVAKRMIAERIHRLLVVRERIPRAPE